MLKISVEGFPSQGIEKAVKDHILDSLNDEMQNLQAAIRVQSPRDLGDHSKGYRVELFKFRGDEIFASLVNEVANSLYRERGRPPGKMPPISALQGWAKRRGLSAYLVAKKIGDKGTQRWIDNENPLGIDRSSQPGAIIVNSDSIILVYLDEAIKRANQFSY